MRDYQKYATIVAVFAAVLYAALLVASFGMISLVTNLEVISDPDAGSLVGLVMSGVAVLVVFLMMLLLGVRTPPERQRIVVGYAIGTGFAALAAFLLTGVLLYGRGEGVLANLLSFPGELLLAPFSWTVGILAFIITVVYSWLLAARFTERGRPLWPWERRGE
jgi:hypothetical protein